jgi:hypothetical protein
MKEAPLVNRECLLKKFPGKGGWTYAEVPEIAPDPTNPFGWVQVRGSIDGYALSHCKLMPMGRGRLFLPVRAEIRKAIGKRAGDSVWVTLYRDTSEAPIPDEILSCFANEPPLVAETFAGFTPGERKSYLDWICQAKTEETRANRIARMMERLERGLRLHDP